MTTFAYEDRWKLASHLQKAIRRGLADEAEWAVRELWPLDHTYVRARMAVIAVEDVAGASPELVATHFGPGWTKRALDERGGVEAVVTAARAMAEAEKDRVACDFWSCCQWLTEFQGMHGAWDALTVPEAIDLAWDRSQPWWARGLAAWRALGTKAFGDRSELLPRLAGDPVQWLAACREEGLDATGLTVLEHAGKAQGEPHPVFLPLAWDLRRRELGQPAAPGRPLVDLGKVGPWLSCALDAHTAEGRAAIKHLLARNGVGQRFLAAHGRTDDLAVRAVGKLWFLMEGGHCPNLRSYPSADRIARDIRQRFLSRPQPMNGSELFQHFGQPEAWQEARLHVMGLTPRPSRPRPG